MKFDISALERFSLRNLPDNLVFLYQSAARGDVLKGVSLSLLQFENCLINTATGEYRELRGGDLSHASALAEAARDLTPSASASPSILLLLPPTDFAATSYQMALSGEKLVRSALQLQAHSLIPAYEDRLLLGVNAARSEGVALWYPAARADELFAEFQARGLFLAALMPRSLALAQAQGAQRLVIRDHDNRNLTALMIEDGAIASLQTVSRRDLEQEEFARQWELAVAQLRAEREVSCASREDWLGMRRRVESLPAYAFLPEGSLQEGRRLEAVKRRKVYAGLGVAALLVLCLPFVMNWFRIQGLERRVENFRETSAEARMLQEAVLAMEDEWGPLYEYPRQDVVMALRALNEVIEGGLQQFSIDKGVIDITGTAQDTAFLVTELAEREEFYNVSQSRTNLGNRFGIRMNLSGVDFEEYLSKYPLPGR